MRPLRFSAMLPLIVAAHSLAALGAEPKSDTPAADVVPEPGSAAEVVPLPPSWRSQQHFQASSPQPEKEKARETPAPQSEPGFTTVITGKVEKNLILGPEQSPVLFKGSVIIPAGVSVEVKAGAFIHFRADSNAEKPADGSPDPSQSAVVWVWGSLNIEGLTGNVVELVNDDKTDALLLMYGAMQ